jgi:hypothetical protein
MISIIAIALINTPIVVPSSQPSCNLHVRKHYSIPGGPLNEVLTTLVELTATSAIYQSEKFGQPAPSVPGIEGDYTVLQAYEAIFRPAMHVSASQLSPCVIHLERMRLESHPEHKRWVALQGNRRCLCWAIDHRLGTPWCTWDDDRSLGVDESCRERSR